MASQVWSLGRLGAGQASGVLSGCLHVDPLPQRALQVLLADGVCEGSQCWLELGNGGWQVSEPAAQLHLPLEGTDALSSGMLPCDRLQGREEQATGQGGVR